MRTIAAVTVGRSDVSVLLPILRTIEAAADLRLRVVVTGAHLSPKFGDTLEALDAEGFRDRAEVLHMPIDSDTPVAIGRAMGLGVVGAARLWEANRPDILLVVGDRFETFAVVVSSLPFNIPVAHVHGGEVTEGAIDDAIRHAITKLSHLHFVAAEAYRQRLLQMGEEPWRVVTSGAPALDNLRSVRLLSRWELEQMLRLPLEPAPLLVTYHPVTRRPSEVARDVDEVLAALSDVRRPLVFTYPNADPGHDTIMRKVWAFVRHRENARLFTNLGTQVYFSLMAYSAAMVGNSSSGIIEAPSFRLPVVNVGDRQKGRLKAANVLDVPVEAGAIRSAIDRATSPGFRSSLSGLTNPYGDGHAAEKIVAVLQRVPLDEHLLVKRFVDWSAPQ